MYSIFGRYLLAYCIFIFVIFKLSKLPNGTIPPHIAVLSVCTFWIGLYFTNRWNLYHRHLENLSEKSLNGLERDWIDRFGWQKTSEIGQIRNAGNNTKTIAALGRILNIQEALLNKSVRSNEKWTTTSVEKLKQRIQSTKEEINSRKPHGHWNEILKNEIIISPKIISVEETVKPEQESLTVVLSPAIKAVQKPRQKSNRILFLESFDKFLDREGKSPRVKATLKSWLKSYKILNTISENNKQKAAEFLYRYIEQTSPEELEQFGDILTKYIEATEK